MTVETWNFELTKETSPLALTQRAHGTIITSFLRRNDAATSFRRNNDTIIMLCVRWGKGELCDVFCEFLEKNDRVISRAPYSNGKMIHHPLQLVSVTLSAEYMTSVRMVYLRPLNSCEPSCHSGCSNTNTSPVSAEWWENYSHGFHLLGSLYELAKMLQRTLTNNFIERKVLYSHSNFTEVCLRSHHHEPCHLGNRWRSLMLFFACTRLSMKFSLSYLTHLF